ncbi:uncharacterized protein [Mycetomoellerius zeteki]|uniref:uncharacterized protein n=1 Tax=Mycetomoellerius zeteki TaxID=64791 RepID=UPI00084EBCDE|nr:PREDICTED: uncharacterized protein LOC108727529 [Trachymyrmex zeteki]
MPRSSNNRYIFKQKSAATRNKISEIPIDDGIIQIINKYNRQLLLRNQTNGFPQNKKVLNNLKRNLRKRKKHVKNLNNEIVYQNNYVDDDDINRDTSLNAARFPTWRILKSTLAVINLDSTTNPSIMETEIINRPLLDAFERPPSQLDNLDRSVDKAIFPAARQYPNSQRLLDLNASNKNLILSRIASPKSEITVNVQSPAIKGLNNKMLLPASNKRYLLVPVSKNLYVLKNVRESSRTGVDGIIIPKRYKLLEKDNDNATSAILSFKAHMHHGVKDVGRAYLQRGNLHLFDHSMNYLYSTLEPRVSEENPVSPSYPDFLYPDIAFQTDPNLIDVTFKISEEQVVFPVPDYKNISLMDVNLRGRINFYDSSTLSSPFHGKPSTLSAAKLNEVSPIRQNSGNYRNSLEYSEFGVELTTTDFRDTFDTHDEYIYTPATLEDEIDLINDKEVFDMPQSREDDPKVLTESNEDESITDFIDDISMQYRAAFDTSANEDNTFFPNITNSFVNNAILNSQNVDKYNQEYGISISSEYNNKVSTHSNDFYYNNRSIDEVLCTNYTTEVDSFLNEEDYVTSAPLLLNTNEWLLKKAQSNVENSNALLMAIKPLSSELQKLLNAIQLVNQSISDVQSRLCDKKEVVGSARTERESKNRNATNITKLIDKVDYYDSDFSTKSFNNQSLDKRRIEIEGKNIAERDVKIRRKAIFLNKLMTPFYKRKSSISDSEVQSGHRNFLKKKKLNEKEFSKSGDRLLHSRFNRNLKSLTKNYETRMKPIRQFIGSKKMKRTTMPILRLSHLIKSDISSENFAGGRRNHQENDQSRLIILPDNTPSLNMSGSGKEKKFHPTDPQFYKEATAYLDILELLGKTENVEYATDVWTTQKLMESLPLLIFTTTEFFVPTSTFLPYFTEAPTITAFSTIAEKKEIFEITESSLYEYVTIVSSTRSPVTLSASTITMSTTLSLLYMTELTILSMEEAAISITDLTITVVAIEVTESPITIPMVENFTTESVMLLTPFLEGMTDITLKITIPVATMGSIEEIPALIAVTVATEGEIVENTSTSLTMEITRSSFIETNISLYTFPSVSLFGTTQTELMIKTTTSAVSVLTSPAITKASQIATSEFIVSENITLHKAESTTAIASSLMVLEQTEMILSTSTEITITTLIPEDESPVSQIEKTITAEETATEIPTTTETPTPETTITTTETLTTATEIPMTIEATTITTSIPTEILTVLKTPITEETTSTKTSTLSTTLTSLKIKTTEIPTTSETSTITEILFIKTTITEILPINKTVTTAETPTTIETSIASKILMISTIPTTIATTITITTTTTTTETSTEILTTHKTPIIKETTSTKIIMPTETPTPIETKTTTETSTIIEISTSTKITKITEFLATNKSVITAGTPTSIETLTVSEIPTTSTIPTTIATPTAKTLTFTKILTTYKTPIIKEITGAKTLRPTETLTPIEIKTTTETSTIIEISTTIETTTITKLLTITETLTTTETAFTETPIIRKISTTSTIPTIAETTAITETLTPSKIIAITKIPTIKKIVSTKSLTPTITETPSSTETQIITEILTITESLGSTEIPVISTTSITTVFFATSENITSSVTTSPKEFFQTSTLTILTTIFTTETAESILISTTTPGITPLQTLIINTTLSETPCTTISSMPLTTTKGAVTTSFKTAVTTTSLKVTTTTPLSLVTSTMSSEMPNTTLSTFLTEETTASLIPTTASSFETLHTKAVLPISTTISTIETLMTISSILTVNATVFSTTASTITAEILKSTSSLTYFTVTTPSITQIPIKPIVLDTGTTAYETTSTLVTSSLLIETVEGTTSSVIEYEETKESGAYYYETTKEEIATVTSTAKLTTERTTTWITTKEVTIIEETTPMTFYITSFSVETTSEATSFIIETITLPTIIEETLSIEKIVTVTPGTMIEGMSSLSEVILISTETSTMPAIGTSTSTSSVLTTAATTVSLLEETATEITETSLITITTTATLLPTTERPKYATILEAAVTVTLAPFSEFILSIIITSETPVISTLPKTVSEEFTISTTESPSITYVTQSSILVIETTIYPTVSISPKSTEESLEAETEYYVAKEPFYEEEYEEYKGYDTKIPIDRWYYYDEYETTTKGTTMAEKYTKLLKEKAMSPPFIEGTTTSLYKIKTSEFTKYPTPSEAASIYVNVTSTVATSGISYTHIEKVTSISTLETSTSTIVENVTTVKVETEFTASAASKEIESTTMWLTFGSTEEYTLPSSTTFKIPTEPLEYLTIPPKYTDVERFTRIWLVTSPKFTTKPKEIPKIALKKTTTPEQVSETETAVEKLTSFFISSTLTTLPEREIIEVHLTTMSTASSEMEGIIKTAYEVTTSAMTEEETIPSVTPFITSEAEIEFVFTTMSTTVEQEQKERLLQRLDNLKQHEREMAEREERLKEREKQWDIEKEKRRKMMQREKEREKNITATTGITESYETTTISTSITSPIYTIGTRNLTVLTTEIEITSPGFEISITTLSLVEITTVPIKTTLFSTTEKITSETYTTEKMEEETIAGSTSVTYATEETIIPYTIEKSTSITHITKETEEIQITDYITLTPYVTTSVMDLYNIGLASIETTTSYTIKETYTVSYVFETPFSITEEIIPVTYTMEKTEEAIEETTFTPYVTEETEEIITSYTAEKSTSITYTEEIEEMLITDYVTFTPYITTPVVDLYSIGLATIETTTPYTVREIYTTSYVTLYSESLFVSPTITSPITLITGKFITLPITTFSERFEEISVTSVTTPTWYTTEETYIVTYTDIYGKPLFSSTELEFTITLSTMAISTTTEVKYDEEIEKLKEELRKKERELEEREKILLEREKRLERDIMEFNKYMKEFEKKITSIIPSEKSTMLTSLSTPVPPTERTTIKAQLTTQIERITEKKENRTTKMGITRHTEMKDIEEKKQTYIPEKTVTQEEEEIMTKRVCLNVLENTTIPFDKRRRDIVTRKICLPYFPEKNEEKKSVGRLSRRLLALPSTKKIKRPRWNVPSNFRYRRREKEITRKIENLQLSHYEWLSNNTTKPLQYFKGFTRIYKKMRKFPKKITMQRNTTNDFQNSTSLYDQHVFDYHESIFQPTTTFMLDSKKYGKRNAFFRYDLISTRKSDCSIDDKASVQKRDVSSIENNERFWSKKNTANISNQKATTAAEEDEVYTVNVLHLNYNEDKQTHEVISAKPDEDELTAILFESNDDIYVTEFGKDRKITTPNYKIEEKDEDNEISDKMEKKIEEYNDYIEDLIEDYMNYEEHETSTQTHDGRLLDNRNKDKRMTENEKELLNQTWPIEKSTMYHLGGTRFWKLDFVTELPILRTTTDKSKTIDESITKTTCFDVVLKRNDKIKSNISYYKRHLNNNRMIKHVSIEKRDASLENVTRMNALRYKLRTKQPRVVAKKLKRESQKHEPKHYKQGNFEKKRTVKFNDFRCTSDSAAKNRKLCIANANKLKHQIVKHEDTNKHKKKQLVKPRTSQNLHSLHNTDNGVINKKNAYHKTTTANQYLQVRISFSLDEIKALNCSEYKEIQDKIVISMDSDMEEAREFPQPHYNTESLKGQKYIKLEELEDNLKSNSELDSDNDVISLPGLNLNLPCNQDGNGITWLSSLSRPSYTWKRMDSIALFGFVAENGDLELRNVNAKDTGNYTCVMTYMSPDNEESVETTYEVHLQVVTLPRYIVHGENRYHVRSCDEGDLDVLVTYLPLKLNNIICEADVCNAYVLTPSCTRSQITVNILLVPSHIVKLMTVDPKHCNVFCLKAIQDKLSLILSKNLQIFLGKTIIFRLPHYEQRLVPIVEKSSFARRKRGKTDANVSVGRSSNIGLFSSCPAGYGLRDTHCVPCNVGTYSEDGISHCKRCPPGTYQPNHGARVCRTCTNPMTKGCYNMLWNSFSAVMVTLASIGAMLSICLLSLWIICCAKKKFCVKRMAGFIVRENTFEGEKHVEEQPLIKDASENEDQQWDSEYRIKKKKGKFYLHEDEWGSHRIKNVPIISPDSYRSHEDYNNHYPKRSCRKGPRLPECDFDT